MREADSQRLKEADSCRRPPETTRGAERGRGQEQGSRRPSDDKEKGLWEARTKARKTSSLSTELDDADRLQGAKEALIAAGRRDAFKASQKQAELELLKLQGAYDAAQKLMSLQRRGGGTKPGRGDSE